MRGFLKKHLYCNLMPRICSFLPRHAYEHMRGRGGEVSEHLYCHSVLIIHWEIPDLVFILQRKQLSRPLSLTLFIICWLLNLYQTCSLDPCSCSWCSKPKHLWDFGKTHPPQHNHKWRRLAVETPGRHQQIKFWKPPATPTSTVRNSWKQ